MKYFICIFFGIASALDEPNVTLADGTKVIGKLTKSVNNVTVWKFLGIPYAQPPIDQLRFMPPQPLATKKGVIYATEFSPICQQNINGSYLEKWIIEQQVQLRRDACASKRLVSQKIISYWKIFIQCAHPFQISVSEDCLYLNVWVPKKANEQSALPVMVWIHGGGFYAGSSRNPVTEGTTLAARENVILVSMNYRLSVFGFAFAGIPEAPGNMGLLDQLEALKWVKVNIASFGGNPEAITLFGVSAGGASVSLHGLSPISRPFFNRIIAQSGVASNPWATRSGESIKRSLLQCATVVNCYSSGKGAPDFAAIVGCLKTKTSDELLRTFRSLSDEVLLITFVPVVDGHFLPDKPENMLNSGSLPPLDMLLGTVSNEAGIFLYVYFSEYFKYSHMGTLNISSEDYKTMVKASIPPNQRENPLIVKATLFEYDDQADSFLRASALANLIGDIHFDAGAEHTARRYTSTNVNVYRYVFNYENTEMKLPWMKCPHASDEPFVFGYPLLNPKVEKNRIKMSKVMMRFWANFARTG
uniref:Carboxylic ester hydrolase n=1 Tax=Romanomermis culicivorax TaxID=13658 RepID=A0A915JDP8_ROMCU